MFQVPVVSGGRLLTLAQPTTLDSLVARVKTHLSLAHVRVACPQRDGSVSTIAACAGSGSQVLRGVQADVYLTGTMCNIPLPSYSIIILKQLYEWGVCVCVCVCAHVCVCVCGERERL